MRQPSDAKVARGVLRAVQRLRRRHPEAVSVTGDYEASDLYIIVRALGVDGQPIAEEWVAYP